MLEDHAHFWFEKEGDQEPAACGLNAKAAKVKRRAAVFESKLGLESVNATRLRKSGWLPVMMMSSTYTKSTMVRP